MGKAEFDVEAAANAVWERIGSAYHWGDGFSDAYSELKRALENAYQKGKDSGAAG